jgi:hypothetical protein
MLVKINDMETATTKDQEHVVIPEFKDWLIYMIIAAIPLIGLIMLIVWAVDGNKQNLIRKRWAGAALIINIALFTLAMLFWFSMIASLVSSGKMQELEKRIKFDTTGLNTTDPLLNRADTAVLPVSVDTAGMK